MARLHTHNRRRARRFGPHTDLEKRMGSHDEGAAVIARIRARGFPGRLCVGLACIGGWLFNDWVMKVIYTLPGTPRSCPPE